VAGAGLPALGTEKSLLAAGVATISAADALMIA
jgi:hypothetical protein